MASDYRLKTGSLIEYTTSRDQGETVTVGEGTVGVVTKELLDGRLECLCEDGTARTIHRHQVVAQDWVGWIPESLEAIYDELNPSDNGDFYP